MKRIKLFEAFTNTNKIEKANHLLLCWCVEEFIKEQNPKIDLRGACLRLSNSDSFMEFVYCDDYKSLDIWCMPLLKPFLFRKAQLLYESPFSEEKRIALLRAAKKVIKEIYDNEKNKTI